MKKVMRFIVPVFLMMCFFLSACDDNDPTCPENKSTPTPTPLFTSTPSPQEFTPTPAATQTPDTSTTDVWRFVGDSFRSDNGEYVGSVNLTKDEFDRIDGTIAVGFDLYEEYFPPADPSEFTGKGKEVFYIDVEMNPDGSFIFHFFKESYGGYASYRKKCTIRGILTETGAEGTWTYSVIDRGHGYYRTKSGDGYWQGFRN